MSDTSAFGFGKFVPGFDFLQNLSQTASKTAPAAGAIPGMPSWVAPTLNVEDIDKRIQELKAVQFWLEQNGTALKATIQALEVQKMTLTTLQGMNVSMADLAKAFTAKAPPASAPAGSAAVQPEAEPEVAAEATPEPAPESAAAAKPKSKKGAAEQPAVDPMAWWGSLTQQFQNIAGAAMKDVAAEAMKAQAAAKAASKASAPAAGKAAPKPAKSSARPAKAASKKAPAKKAARKSPAGKSPARQRPAA